MKLKRELLEYSFRHQLGHIPSALSMFDYLWVLFNGGHVTRDDIIVIGKPFGAQAYYTIWKELGWLDDIEHLSVGVKDYEIPFVTYSEETIGNALGIAAGIAMATDKRVWVNITDASLQMGNMLEAIQFIGQHRIHNIIVTVDYNDAQVTGCTSDIISIEPVRAFARNYDWYVQDCDGHHQYLLDDTFSNMSPFRPNIVFCDTVKGYGFPEMEQDIKKWHYKKLSSTTEIEELLNASYLT